MGEFPLDTENPCLRAMRLRVALDDLMLGKSVIEVGFGDDRVRYTRADTALIQSELARAEAACRESMGLSAAPRRRYALGVRARPY